MAESLTGVDPADPIPGIIREISFAQGASLVPGTSRDVVLMANKLSAGSETVNTLGDPINDEQDCIDRFGAGSGVHLMYRCFTQIPQSAQIYAIGVTDAGSASTVTVTIADSGTNAVSGVVRLTVIGETVEAAFASGDSVTTIAAALVVKIQSQTHWPVTATSLAGVITITTKNTSATHVYHLTQLRTSVKAPASTTITSTKGSVTDNSAVDDYSTAITLLDTADIYYQVMGRLTSSNPSTNDNGIGEHSTYIKSAVLPSSGKSCQGFAGLTTTATLAADYGNDAAMNNPRYYLFHAENSDWSAGMIAAHCCAAVRSKQISYPAANLTDYGKNPAAGEVLNIPDPFVKTDRVTDTEKRTLLNNGVSSIGFTANGQAYIVRHVSNYCLNGSNYDYGAREGHIVSAIDYAWETIKIRYITTAQDNVADDPAEGQKPLINVTYPRDVGALIAKVVTDLINFGGGPILDPSEEQAMINSIAVSRLTDGISARVGLVAVKHNNKGQFKINEVGVAY